MAETSGGLIESVIQLVVEFGKIAVGVDPLVTALLLSGAIITGLSVSVFTYLAGGAVLDLVLELMPSGRQPPQQE
jgi:hypothetical protein